MAKPTEPVCNAAMLEGTEARRLAGWKPVRCQLPPGHEGNHFAKMPRATFQWWNKEHSPQREKA